MDRMRVVVSVGSVLAWASAGVLAVAPMDNARPFVLAVAVAVVLTIPLLTVVLARKHVHAYLAGWVDRHEHGGGPDGGTECAAEDDEQRTALRAA